MENDFNLAPTKPAEKVIFTNRNSTPYDTLTYSGVNVEPVDGHKHLSVGLDRKMISNLAYRWENS